MYVAVREKSWFGFFSYIHEAHLVETSRDYSAAFLLPVQTCIAAATAAQKVSGFPTSSVPP